MKFAKLIISLFVVISGFTFHSNAIAQAAFEKVDAFSRTVCGLREDGDVECRSTSDFDTPLPSDLPAAQDVAAGLAATCLIVADGGELLCIGTGAFGLDNPPSEGAPYQAVDVSVAHACAINRDNGIECWGLDTNDRLNAPEGQFTQLSLSQEQQGCAVDVNGGVSCWGANDQGTLDVPDDLPAALKVGTGFASSCALLEDGTIRCWGRDIPAFPGTFTDFDMQANGSAQRGSASICAIDAQGEITCRFYSYDGQDEPPVLRDDLDTFTGTGHTDISVPTFGTACSVNSSAEIECVSLFSSLSDIDLNEPLPQSASVTTGLRVLVYSATSAELIWNAPTDPFNVAGHEIQRNGEIFAFTQNSSSFLLNDLTEGEPETFAVRRVDVNGKFIATDNLSHSLKMIFSMTRASPKASYTTTM